MPRFFFDVHDGVDLRDEVGRALADGEAARREALQVATKLLAEEADDAREVTLVLTVRDEAGKTAVTIRLVCQTEVA